MPCEYEIDLTHRLVRTRAWGAVTHAELTAMRVRLTGDPAFQSDFSQLYDLREAVSLAMTADEIRELASYSHFGANSRRAIVAPKIAAFGTVRMFAIQREASGGQDEVRAFRSLAEANDWLGLEG